MAANSNLINDMLRLVREGFARYDGPVEQQIFDRLDCRQSKRAAWFVRGAVYCCLGCSRRCALTSGQGFQVKIPVAFVPASLAANASLPNVTALDLIHKKILLRVDEVAFVTGLGRRTVYDRIDEGVFEIHPERTPVRIYAESVKRYLGLK